MFCVCMCRSCRHAFFVGLQATQPVTVSKGTATTVACQGIFMIPAVRTHTGTDIVIAAT